MAQRRLNKTIREDIYRDLMKRGFGDKVKDLKARAVELAHDVHDDAYGAEMLRQMEELPDGWLPRNNRVKIVYREGEDGDPNFLQLNFTSGLSDWTGWFSYWNNKEDTPFEFLHHTNPEPNPRGQGRRVPTKDNNSSSAKASYDAGHDFIKRHRSLLKEQDELLDQIKKASNETRAVLFDGSVNTAEKLIKVWPEIEAVVDRHVPKTVKKAGLPAPKLDGLNKALDLPPETKETEKA